MLSSFQLSVPADARYRVLAPEVAAKYAALAGCSDVDARAVLTEVEAAAAQMAASGDDIAVSFAAAAGELVVTLSCAGRSTTVRRASAGVE